MHIITFNIHTLLNLLKNGCTFMTSIKAIKITLDYISDIINSLGIDNINTFKDLINECIKTNGKNMPEILSFLYKNKYIIFNDLRDFNYVLKLLINTPQNTNNLIKLCNNYVSYHKIKNFKNSPFTIYAYASYMAYQEQTQENPVINRFFEKHMITKKYENTNVFKILVTHKVNHNGNIERIYIIAFKGTDPLKLADLKSDINIALKNKENDKRFQYCLSFVNMFKRIPKYSNSKIILTGHSLGGSIAIYVSSKLNLPCVVFNPGTSIEMNMNYNHKMLVIHKCNEDPICSFSGFSGTTFVYKTGKSALEAHSLDNFLQLRN